jgi:hypothetical protein
MIIELLSSRERKKQRIGYNAIRLKTKSSLKFEECRNWSWIEDTGDDGRLSTPARDAAMELKDLDGSRVKLVTGER